MSKKKQSASTKAFQCAVIPIRIPKKGKPEILLLTSRGKGRWGIPKGWPMQDRSPREAARREAFEEAGLKGHVIRRRAIGRYRYRKNEGDRLGKITVAVFVMQVDRQVRSWPEKPERKTRWFSPAEAAERIPDRRLGRLLKKAARIARMHA
jgi:8-oxo-dGTP pyrophosphatase MutT (NUDIX family)